MDVLQILHAFKDENKFIVLDYVLIGWEMLLFMQQLPVFMTLLKYSLIYKQPLLKARSVNLRYFLPCVMS